MAELEIESGDRAEGVIEAGDVLTGADRRRVIKISGAPRAHIRLVRAGIAEEERVGGIEDLIHTPTILIYRRLLREKIVAVKPVQQWQGCRRHILGIGDSTSIQHARNVVVQERSTCVCSAGAGRGGKRVVKLV